MIVCLDAEAMNALAGPDSRRKQQVRRILRAAQRLGRDVLVPSVVLAELYRGRGFNQLVDACLARERASLETRDTDRHLARIVGGVLTAAGAGSTMIVDAHVVAAVVEAWWSPVTGRTCSGWPPATTTSWSRRSEALGRSADGVPPARQRFTSAGTGAPGPASWPRCAGRPGSGPERPGTCSGRRCR